MFSVTHSQSLKWLYSKFNQPYPDHPEHVRSRSQSTRVEAGIHSNQSRATSLIRSPWASIDFQMWLLLGWKESCNHAVTLQINLDTPDYLDYLSMSVREPPFLTPTVDRVKV